MREAVGGSLLFYIILGFLAVFIVFIALIMNYAAAYRASNYVLTMIERTEGQVAIGTSSSVAGDGTLVGALKERKYYNMLAVSCSEVNRDDGTVYGSIYKITTSVPFSLPLINSKLNLYINNETKTIYNVPCNNAATGEVNLS